MTSFYISTQRLDALETTICRLKGFLKVPQPIGFETLVLTRLMKAQRDAARIRLEQMGAK